MTQTEIRKAMQQAPKEDAAEEKKVLRKIAASLSPRMRWFLVIIKEALPNDWFGLREYLKEVRPRHYSLPSWRPSWYLGFIGQARDYGMWFVQGWTLENMTLSKRLEGLWRVLEDDTKMCEACLYRIFKRGWKSHTSSDYHKKRVVQFQACKQAGDNDRHNPVYTGYCYKDEFHYRLVESLLTDHGQTKTLSDIEKGYMWARLTEKQRGIARSCVRGLTHRGSKKHIAMILTMDTCEEFLSLIEDAWLGDRESARHILSEVSDLFWKKYYKKEDPNYPLKKIAQDQGYKDQVRKMTQTATLLATMSHTDRR